VADFYLVEQGRGPAWDYSKRRREQAGWDEHAAFMDALTDEGVVVLGGLSAGTTVRTCCSSSTSRARRRSALVSLKTPGRTAC
jgi:hypothetical protein